MSVLKYNEFVKLNEANILSRGIEKIKEFIGKISDTFKKFFSQKNVKVEPIDGGYKGTLIKNGKETVTVYDFSSAKEASTNEAVIPMESTNEDIPDIDNDELIEELELHFMTKQSLFIWGASGIGKSSIMLDYCKRKRMGLIILPLASMEPADLLGLPAVSKRGEYTGSGYEIPFFWPRDEKALGREEEGTGIGGIIFLDELNLASRPIWNAIQLILTNRGIDDYRIPKNWILVIAGNRMGEGDITALTGAQANRPTHVNFVPSFKKWVEFGEKNKSEITFDKKESDERGSKNGPEDKSLLDNEAKVRTVSRIAPEVIAFLTWAKDEWHKFEPERLGDGAPWPSPRSWDDACQLYYAKLKLKSPDGSRRLTTEEVIRIFQSKVGKAAALKFANFYKMIESWPVTELDKVWEKPDAALLPPKKGGQYEPDKTWAVLTAIALHKNKKQVTMQEFDNVLKYLIRMDNGEYANYLRKMLWIEHPEAGQWIEDCPTLQTYHDKYGIDDLSEYNKAYAALNNKKEETPAVAAKTPKAKK